MGNMHVFSNYSIKYHLHKDHLVLCSWKMKPVLCMLKKKKRVHMSEFTAGKLVILCQ